jgi:hypothetical protein
MQSGAGLHRVVDELLRCNVSMADSVVPDSPKILLANAALFCFQKILRHVASPFPKKTRALSGWRR